jgi:metal-responsive CopG/Arc/MetJ family transcriptional regulator
MAKPITLRLEETVLDRIDRLIKVRSLPRSRNHYIVTALIETLEAQEKKFLGEISPKKKESELV